ncbi:MAG: fructose 1,6-bisphosphatase [Candidatus Sungbacteria bacterium]|nr:fructose 1,6-bisphosphatase [bacterium]MDZ4260695.1 fructose 1,6-bisphosphatase [Candidatus Sungbacteria bacterium]
MSRRMTVSVIKADVGSIGGHTKPSEAMLDVVCADVQRAVDDGKLIDFIVTHTGDDIAIIMSHEHGKGAHLVHQFAWQCFLDATQSARKDGCYAAGQDLLVDAPSGNIRGAGPAVAEIEFTLLPEYRPAEAFMVFAADKCGPGAYNMPFYLTFCDPMHNGGLLLSPKLHQGFTLGIMDMDYQRTDRDSLIYLDVPERVWDVAALLRDTDRFAIEEICSRAYPAEQVAAISATRLHNIAGKYTGKDDPIALVRVQGIFPAPEEMVEAWMLGHFVTGDARGSHVMPIMPVAINTPVAGPYCLPIVSCLTFSMDKDGHFSREYVDVFGDKSWDAARLRIQEKAYEWRRQGFFGPTMAAKSELAYTGIVDTLNCLEKEFIDRQN